MFGESRPFTPLAMNGTRYWPGPGPMPPGAAPLAAPNPAPLSLVDGAVWSTASDMLRCGQALNADEPGICRLIETPGNPDDGTPLDYGWVRVSVRTGATGFTVTAASRPGRVGVIRQQADKAGHSSNSEPREREHPDRFARQKTRSTTRMAPISTVTALRDE